VASPPFNYALRPNKNVERKIIFDALRALTPAFPFSAYRYIGFGSLWFVDFILAHRELGIEEMISIERDPDRRRRAEFNQPFGTIKIEEGESAVVLPMLDLARKPAVVWLDYESRIGEVLEELAIACARLPSGSVLIATVNASKDPVTAATEAERQKLQEEAFKAEVGQLAPAQFPDDFFHVSQYRKNLGVTLVSHLERATRKSGRDERFIPLFHFAYKDGAQMVTVGGMIANGVDRARLAAIDLRRVQPFATGAAQEVIDIPTLTTREKLAIDRLLPRTEPLSGDDLEEAGIPLKEAAVAQYRRHYLQYPVFAEFLP
jgi:hypothetical protein